MPGRSGLAPRAGERDSSRGGRPRSDGGRSDRAAAGAVREAPSGAPRRGPARFAPRGPRSDLESSLGPSWRRPRPFWASVTCTPASTRGGPMISIGLPRRSTGDGSFRGRIESTSTPSSPLSTSARRISPIFVPEGTRSSSSVPRGSRAPAARQVNRPSPSLLVSSISMRRATTRKLAASLRSSRARASVETRALRCESLQVRGPLGVSVCQEER